MARLWLPRQVDNLKQFVFFHGIRLKYGPKVKHEWISFSSFEKKNCGLAQLFGELEELDSAAKNFVTEPQMPELDPDEENIDRHHANKEEANLGILVEDETPKATSNAHQAISYNH